MSLTITVPLAVPSDLQSLSIYPVGCVKINSDSARIFYCADPALLAVVVTIFF
jgi:hypothetical protein